MSEGKSSASAVIVGQKINVYITGPDSSAALTNLGHREVRALGELLIRKADELALISRAEEDVMQRIVDNVDQMSQDRDDIEKHGGARLRWEPTFAPPSLDITKAKYFFGGFARKKGGGDYA